MAKKQLTFTEEQAGWLNDILADYEAMIVTAKNTIKELRNSWEEIFKGADPEKAETKKLVEDLEKLKLDEGHVNVADQRYRALQNIVFDFMWITPETNAPQTDTGPAEWIDTIWDEPLHAADEDQETVSA